MNAVCIKELDISKWRGKRGKDIVNPCWCNHDSEIRENVSLDNCQRDFINVLFENFKQQPRCTIVKENANCFEVGAAAASKLVLISTANYQMIKKNWRRLFLYSLKTERSCLLLLKKWREVSEFSLVKLKSPLPAIKVQIRVFFIFVLTMILIRKHCQRHYEPRHWMF